MQPKVSVIIPVYNTEKYLRECLDSVVNQTLKNIEIICVDDGSTDGSLEILREYAEKDSRVKVYTQPNTNAGAARNHGLRYATGEYLAFLDSDDYYETHLLESAVNCAEERNAEIVVYKVKLLQEDTGVIISYDASVIENLLPPKEVFTLQEIEKDAFRCILGYDWDKLIKRNLVERNHLCFQSQAVFNDAYFAYTALLSAQSITVLNEELIVHRKRQTQESITDKRFLHTDCSYQFLRGLKEYLDQNDLYSRFERDFINYVIHLFYVDFHAKNRKTTKEMREKIRGWLDEFHVNEHYADYYYNLSSYLSLLKQVLSRRTAEIITGEEISTRKKIEIPILYATDANYMKYVLTSMVSALLYARSNTFYNFYIMIPEAEEEECKSINLEERLSQFDNYSLSYIPIDDRFNNAKLFIEHITTPTFYRLNAPSLLPDVDKCIYLDADTIVCDDLQSLYLLDIQDNYLAGVPAFVYYESAEDQKKRLELDENAPFEYVNAGVLLMNLAKLRKAQEDIFIRLLDKEYESQDQDILNVACYGKIQIIPFKFNVMTKYSHWSLDRYNTWAFPSEIVEGSMYPIIVHYADKRKPWDDFCSPYSNLWISAAMTDMSWDLFSNTIAIGKGQKNTPQKNRSLLRKAIDCYRKHGFRYTFNRLLIHMHLKK